MGRIPHSLNAEGMAVVEAVVSTGAVVAEASMEVVAVATFREVAGNFLGVACAAGDRRDVPA